MNKKKTTMILVIVSMKKPYGILFPKDVTKNEIMGCLGDAILNKRAEIDKYFSISKLKIEEELTEDL